MQPVGRIGVSVDVGVGVGGCKVTTHQAPGTGLVLNYIDGGGGMKLMRDIWSSFFASF